MPVRLTLDTASQDVAATLVCACSEVVMKSRGAEEVVRAKVVIIKGNQVFAVCKRCSTEVPLPLEKAELPAAPTAVDMGPTLLLKK